MADAEVSELRNARLRAILEVVDQSSGGATVWSELWPQVLERVPLTGDEESPEADGGAKAEIKAKWQLTTLDKSRWLLSGIGQLKITAEGRQALIDYPDVASFAEVAAGRYQEWMRLREPSSDLVPRDIDTELAPAEPGFRVAEAAALHILQEGMRDAGSAFVPGRAVWTPEAIQSLRHAFIEQPDLGDSKFLEKLEGQLRGASDDTVLLTAELLALALLPLAFWKPDTKRQRVKAVLGMMQQPVHMPTDINAAMEIGVFTGGLAFQRIFGACSPR